MEIADLGFGGAVGAGAAGDAEGSADGEGAVSGAIAGAISGAGTGVESWPKAAATQQNRQSENRRSVANGIRAANLRLPGRTCNYARPPGTYLRRTSAVPHPEPPVGVTIVDHPLIRVKLTRVRAARTSSEDFRRELRELATLMAFEVARDFETLKKRKRLPTSTASR